MKKFITLAAAVFCLTATMLAQTPKQVQADCGDQVTLTATPETGYHFVRWNDGTTDYTDNPLVINPVNADASFRAYFAINVYTITFKNWNDTVLQTGSYTHGDAVTAPTATKTGDAQYTYTFAGWTPTINYTAEADAEYTATFTQTVNKYTITFQNWDGTTLQSSEWEYGATPTYNGLTDPTRPADAENTYTFSGWSPVIHSVTGDETYVAQYNNTTNSYTLTVNGEHGTTTGGGTFLYNTTQTITATPDACYRFVKWSNDDPNATTTVTISGDMTITAIFEKIKYTIEVISDNESQGTVNVTNP